MHGTDGFLGWFLALLIMDDTVLLFTPREACMELMRTQLDSGEMCLNKMKTKVMVINGILDRDIIEVNVITISYSKHLLTLEHWFTLRPWWFCMKPVNKFRMYKRKHTNMPCSFILQVLQATLMSSMLYGWIMADYNLKTMNIQYRTAVILLLGAQTTTAYLLSLIEAGLPEQRSQHQYVLESKLLDMKGCCCCWCYHCCYTWY